MNLGVETSDLGDMVAQFVKVSAFSDESWGGDQRMIPRPFPAAVCFSIL